MDTRGEELLRHYERIKSERSILDAHCQQIAEIIWPDRANFVDKVRSDGGKRASKVFDSTAALALPRFSAAMESYLTPRTSQWHKLRHPDEELNEHPRVQRYLDSVTKILFKLRYAPTANFASQIGESYMSEGAFGTGGILVEDMLGRGFRYKSIDLANFYIAENRYGIIDTAYRCFWYTARQAMQHFKASLLPAKIVEQAEKNPHQKFEFVHAVTLNEEGGKWAFNSYYVSIDGRKIVEEGGYYTFPYAIGRYMTAPNEVYGRSPAMIVLPTIKTLNEMEKTMLRSGHLQVSPPLLMQADGALQGFDHRPDALNYGGLDERGQAMVMPLNVNPRLDWGQDMMETRQRVVNDAFLITLFQILVDAPRMTATEAMLKAQEKGALLAPAMGRQQSEKLGPLITRELDLAARAGQLPEMPRELMERGGHVDIEYISPLNRLQRAEDGVAILRTFEAVMPLAQVDPTVMFAFNLPVTARELAEINGFPAKGLRSPEEIKALIEQQDMMAKANALLQAAPIAADTAKTMVETQSMASQGTAALAA